MTNPTPDPLCPSCNGPSAEAPNGCGGGRGWQLKKRAALGICVSVGRCAAVLLPSWITYLQIPSSRLHGTTKNTALCKTKWNGR